MNLIEPSFFSPDAFAALRKSRATSPSNGTAASKNPTDTIRLSGAAETKLASRSTIGQ